MQTESSEPDPREERRLRAWELKKQGWKQKDIAQALGVSKGAVSQWMNRGRSKWDFSGFGRYVIKEYPQAAAETWEENELLLRQPLGRRPRFSPSSKQELLQFLRRLHEREQYRDKKYTAQEVQCEIHRTYVIEYTLDHVRRLMRQAGWKRR